MVSITTNGYSQLNIPSQGRLAKLYPPESTVIKYHTDWSKEHYKKRIAEFKKDPLKFGDIVFIGNSITEQGGDWSVKFDIPNIKNRGISGDVTDGILKRLDEITYFKPKALFLLIGINDLFNLHSKKEIPSPEYIGNNILKIAEIIHNKTPKTKIYIQTILPTNKNFMKNDIAVVNNIIKQTEKSGFYKVIDLYSEFIDEEGLLMKKFTVDGVHLNKKGYAHWVELEKNILYKNENNIKFVYPDGNTKALIMSYDDGVIEDLRLIKLLDENEIVGTFNLNSGYFGTTKGWAIQNADTLYLNYISKDSLTARSKGHEIAAHGTYHKNFCEISDEEILQEIDSDISNLSSLTKRVIKSVAYPFGCTNEHIAKTIKQSGITNARTVNSTNTFDLPTNFLLWNPTCHDSKALGLLDNYLSLSNDTLSVFYVWGHSWEFNDKTRWNDISEFCKKAGSRNDIWYVGCGEFVDYQLTVKSLKLSSEFILNPEENKQVWFIEHGVLKTLKPGEKILLK